MAKGSPSSFAAGTSPSVGRSQSSSSTSGPSHRPPKQETATAAEKWDIFPPLASPRTTRASFARREVISRKVRWLVFRIRFRFFRCKSDSAGFREVTSLIAKLACVVLGLTSGWKMSHFSAAVAASCFGGWSWPPYVDLWPLFPFRLSGAAVADVVEIPPSYFFSFLVIILSSCDFMALKMAADERRGSIAA